MVKKHGDLIEKYDKRLLILNLLVIIIFLLAAIVGIWKFVVGFLALILLMVLILSFFSIALFKIIRQINKKLP